MREPFLGGFYFTNANGYLQTQRAIKKTAAERDAFGKKVSEMNSEAWSAKLKSKTTKVPL